jgi:mannose-1-phosphate guanylyltransferase
MPELYESLPNLAEKIDTDEMAEEIERVYSATKSISIDYAIMENAENVSVVESEFDWSDVGSWEAVYNLSDKDKNNNVIYAGNFYELDSENNFIYSSENKLIAAIDVKDIILVETDNAILLCHKDSSQRVKEIVDRLRAKDMDEYI